MCFTLSDNQVSYGYHMCTYLTTIFRRVNGLNVIENRLYIGLITRSLTFHLLLYSSLGGSRYLTHLSCFSFLSLSAASASARFLSCSSRSKRSSSSFTRRASSAARSSARRFSASHCRIRYDKIPFFFSLFLLEVVWKR